MYNLITILVLDEHQTKTKYKEITVLQQLHLVCCIIHSHYYTNISQQILPMNK